jgi:AraC-like DNA-binding protein
MPGRKLTVSVLSEVRRTGAGATLQIEHAHQALEFNLVIAGRGSYFLTDRQFDLVPGTLVWLLPGQMHRLMRSPELDMWVVSCEPDALDSKMLDDIAQRPCRVLSTPDAVALDRLFTHISQDADEPSLYEAGLTYAIRSAWSATMNSAGPTARPMHPAVMQALSILRSNAETPTSARLAKMCGVTQDYLGQLLMEHTGRGFVEWRNLTRLERFHILYPKSGDLLTAALDAGFGSYSQFHRVFSEVVGATPGEWAKSGDQPSIVALPSNSGRISGGAAESTRMPSYSLAKTVFPTAARWFTPAFARHFQRPAQTGTVAGPIDSGLGADFDWQQLEQGIIGELRASDPKSAERLETMLQDNDFLDLYRRSYGFFSVDHSDLAQIIGIYLCVAQVVAQRATVPAVAYIRAFCERVCVALNSSAIFANVGPEKRRLVAATFMIQSVILRNVFVAARASGQDEIVMETADAAHATALTTTGIDLRQFDIDRSPPAVSALAS